MMEICHQAAKGTRLPHIWIGRFAVVILTYGSVVTAAHSQGALPNDACAGAILLNGSSGSIVGSNIGATQDGVSPCDPLPGPSEAGEPDVWYSFTPEFNGNLTLSTCATQTTFDTLLTIYDNCPGIFSNLVTCVNDSETCTEGSTLSEVSLCADAGVEYFIRVAGANESVGAFELQWNLEAIAAPTNVHATPQVLCPGGGNVTLSADVGPNEEILWFESSCVATPFTCQTFGSNGSPCTITVAVTPKVTSVTIYAKARDISTGCVSEDCGSVTLFFEDTDPPTVACTDIEVVLDSNGEATISTDDVFDSAASLDGCGGGVTPVSLSQSSFSCADAGTVVPVTVTAEDDRGNAGQCVANVTVRGNTPPVITTVAADQTVECDGNGNMTELQKWLDSHGGATATDNCVTVNWSNDFSALSDLCGETGSATVVFTATDLFGNSETTSAIFLIEDTTPPSLTLPPDVNIECHQSPDTKVTGMASGSDACGAVMILFVDDSSGLIECNGTGQILRKWMATDECGNSANGVQIITVSDSTPPSLKAPSDVLIGCEESIDPSNTGIASADDNCGSASVDFTDISTQTSNGSCGDYSYSITRTWTATDDCGNSSSTDQTINVVDSTAPLVNDSPNDITVHADAGMCAALVSWQPPSVSDACDPNAGLLYDIDLNNDSLIDTADHPDASFIFPSGTHRVAAKAIDACGNENDSCNFLVTVTDLNVLNIELELEGIHEPTLTRCIDFELSDCGGLRLIELIEQEIVFTDGLAQDIALLIPCGAYDCLTARDSLHTLRRTQTDLDGFVISGTEFVADFTGSRALIGGNLNDDSNVDMLDFALLMNQYAMDLGTGDTTCLPGVPHADISGNGVVFVEDFTFIHTRYLQQSDSNCCGLPALAAIDNDAPITRIKVKELWKRDAGHLSVADLNDDGWLDVQDVVVFVNGARPEKLAIFSPNNEIENSNDWFDPRNWSNGYLPDYETDVFVGDSALIDGFATARNVTVEAGGWLNIDDEAVLSLSGDFVQDSLGGLSLHFGLPTGEPLVINGRAYLAGTLNVSIDPTRFLIVGQRYEVLSASSIKGRFDTVELPKLSDSLKFDLQYAKDSVSLVVDHKAGKER